MRRYGHLCVNDFLTTEMDARAIRTALDLGVIDGLMTSGPATLSEIAARRRIDPRGLRLLVDLLAANGVVTSGGDRIALTPAFESALAYRELLDTRIAFADLVWPDIHTLFSALLNDAPQFMARSKVFDLFRYDRCLTVNEDNLAATSAWTRFTTCLTRYEATAALDEIDLSSPRDLVDLGGNTGEFALAVCRRAAGLRATVVDLPVVCELGRRHIAATAAAPEAARIAFAAADMRRDPLPGPADLVTFKSVLHDWPDAEVRSLLTRASTLVRPGGRLLIFERAPIDLGGRRFSYAMAPDLVFLHFLRPADLYRETLRDLGFVDVRYRRIELEIGFHLIVAQRPT